MTKFFKTLSILATIALFINGCGASTPIPVPATVAPATEAVPTATEMPTNEHARTNRDPGRAGRCYRHYCLQL
jgi:predicted small lipoprotein YifL